VAEQRKGRALNDIEVAKFAIDVWGVETLREFRAELEEAGLEPPTTFVGGKKERGWVRVLGFPREYAGFENAQRDPALEIEGPPDLHPLHPFQERSVEKILSILNDESGNRGLLSLPTGAGKTRICVEALVRFAASRKLSGPILWVAQTDELCEQAVQSWSEIWRAFGPARDRMQISRFWGPRDATPFLEGVHVVVATINKLQGCLYSEEYEWLDEASCLVIDEAHSATTQSYSKLLTWQGLDRGHQRCPLIGLTATPYRGGTVQTESLVRRFQAQRLEVVDEFGSDVYAGLQDRGVLARVEHGSLKGTTVTLSNEELKSIEALPENLRTMPAGILARIRRSVGQDASRTELLLNSIKAHPEDWPILVFAASVEHAEIMSGLLNSEGVSAAAISERTNMAARRFYIQEFRAGRIRVLTNYGVLTAGFDAPQIRAVYVARPTYSRSLYQQMVGRGLRGPANGGKELCLIVNVEDNITNFGAQLAFTEFEYLWKTGTAWTADNSGSSPTVANYGANWTTEENKIITNSYLSMLLREVQEEEYVKTDSINEVMSQTGRTRGSVEFKYQNISAWLEQNGYKYIAGYKPAENYQTSLGVVVEEYLLADTSGMLDLLRLEPTN
jgi:superfamily II DNA or RNA helicase